MSLPCAVPVNPGSLDGFREVLTRRFGLSLNEASHGLLSGLLERRASALGASTGEYLDRIASPSAPMEELRLLAQELTVPETYFFRHLDQFRALAEVALPARRSARAASRSLSLLSAGCASGDEAYSLAILLREQPLDPGWTASILGLDLNPAALRKAADGRYSSWSLRETPLALQQRWFRAEGRELVLDPAVRSAVRFEERNLAEEDPSFWQAGTYDVVFCRNMLMYVTPAVAKMLIDRITHALAPGGYLFLGHAETLRGLSHDYHLRHTHGTFYYQRKDVLERGPPAAVPIPAPTLAAGAGLAAGWEAGWMDAVRQASDRIEVLAARKATLETVPIVRGDDPPAPSPKADLRSALELLAHERFADALQLLAERPPAAVADPDALLLEAVLLMHVGKFEQARAACVQLLELDELSAGAHHVLALCREGGGDGKAAMDHDQVAIYLDPTFAMPRLHLGLLSRRAGDPATGRRELTQALALLKTEDQSRLLLFGGGFTRDGLIGLCKAELAKLGGEP
jgi:chemotaxis protein methyltransferase CheR